MCLAVPGKVVEWIDREPPFAQATVQFGGIQRQVNMACMTEVSTGDFVLVHAGIAIGRIDPEEAAQVWKTLEEIDLEELELTDPGHKTFDGDSSRHAIRR